MFEKSISTSTPSQKRRCTENEADFMPKKSKLEEVNDRNKHEFQLQQSSEEKDAGKANKTAKLVSLILDGEKKDLRIFPGQMVWCRFEKTAFWPSMVWSTKAGRITDENQQRVVVKRFAKKDATVWVKLENIFPFDGLKSFEKMKNSVDVHLMTRAMRSDFDFAFYTNNEVWHRAVAEATFCLSKDPTERLALFLAFSSSSNLLTSRKKSMQRRSLELNTSNSSLVNRFKLCDEMYQVESFIKAISFPIPETSSSSSQVEKIVRNEEMLWKFVTESLVSSKFNAVDKLCSICCRPELAEEMSKCAGTCTGYLHPKCFENRFPRRLCDGDNDGDRICIRCDDCMAQSKQFCFICKTDDDGATQSETINCTVPNCLRRYHIYCLKAWPQAVWNGSSQEFICPSHKCHQCADSNDVTKKHITAELTTCIKCPTTVHSHPACIAAGTVIISATRHICIKHRQLRESVRNLDYCYICKAGCNLLYCKTCPHSYHEQCLLSTSTPTFASTCAKCFTGQHPVYGDIVWGKLYTYVWWPAIIVPPHCVPPNIQIDDHSPHDICVCFFGDQSFSWIDRKSVYSFDEDNFALFTESSSQFNEAILSARKLFSQIKRTKSKKHQRAESTPMTSVSNESVSPTPYTTISQNIPITPASLFYDAHNEAMPCQCTAYDEDPCGVYSFCLNRAVYCECNDQCPSADLCANKCIQQGKYADVHLKYFGTKGFGLVSVAAITCGTIVSQYTGEVITSFEFERRMGDKGRSNVYFMKYTKDLYIDGEAKGSLARFINHSCDPNCTFRLWSVNGVNVVAVVALMDIPKDTEITCKYDWSRHIPCLCNANNCSGIC